MNDNQPRSYANPETTLSELGRLQPSEKAADLAVQTVLDRMHAAQPRPHDRQWKRMRLSITGIGVVAGVVAILLMIGLFGAPQKKAFAWSEVAAKIAETKSMKYRQSNQHEYFEIDNGRKKRTRVVNMAFTIHATASGKMRYEDNIVIVIVDPQAGKKLTLIPSTKQGSLETLGKNDPAEPNIYKDFRRIDKLSLRSLEKKQIDGQDAVGFHVDRNGKPWKKGTVLWIDAKSRLPVRVESNASFEDGRHTSTHVLDQFQFDAEFDAKTFSTKPPKGYNVKANEEEKK